MDNEKDITEKDSNQRDQAVSVKDTSYDMPKNQPHIDGKANTLPLDKRQVLFLKSEKLITATYLVASIMPASDPLKVRLEEGALSFLSDVYSKNKDEKSGYCGSLIQSLSYVLGLLSMAFAVKAVSAMNYSILKREYENLRRFIESLKSENLSGESAVISNEFFSIPEEELSLADKAVPRQSGVFLKLKDSYKGQSIKDTSATRLSFINSGQPNRQKMGGSENPKNNAENKSRRKSDVLKIIKKNRTVTIKDLSKAISGCSEKTIQRELSALVADGVLKKEGEKRWSRYSLR